MLPLLQFIAQIFAIFFTLSLLFRLFEVNYYNPLVQQMLRFTNPVLSPLRRIFPNVWRLDISCLLVTSLIHALPLLLFGVFTPLLAVWALLATAMEALTILTYAIFGLVIMSFLAPHSMHPAGEVIRQLAEPLLAPFRGLIPGLPLDISPIFALLGLSLVRMYVLERLAFEFGMPAGMVGF